MVLITNTNLVHLFTLSIHPISVAVLPPPEAEGLGSLSSAIACNKEGRDNQTRLILSALNANLSIEVALWAGVGRGGRAGEGGGGQGRGGEGRGGEAGCS